jgi:hypothetical protein
MLDRALAWLKHIEDYLASGDGDWSITDEDREIIGWLTLRCTKQLVEEQGWLERHNQRVIDGDW